MSLGDRIRQLLRERSWSQAQLAEASGLDPSVLSRALGGERPWKQEHIACIAAVLSKAPEELVAGTDATISGGESDLDAEFVATLTKAHGALVAENGRCSEEAMQHGERCGRIVLASKADASHRQPAPRADGQKSVAVVRTLSGPTPNEWPLLRAGLETPF